MSDDQAHFREVQRFRQWWFLVLVGMTALIGWSAWIEQIIQGGSFGSDPAPDLVVWLLWVLLGLVVPVVTLGLRLETTVAPGEITIGFPPFPRRVVATDAILEAHAEQIRPITQWGGYGYRRNLRGGTAFLVRGRMAVELTLPEDERLVIGTQQPVRLATAIVEARRLRTPDP